MTRRTTQEASLLGWACGITISWLRQRAGFAQEAFAHDTGIGRAYMSALERGRHIPSLAMIYRMLPLFGVTLEQFAKMLADIMRWVNAFDDERDRKQAREALRRLKFTWKGTK